MIRGNSAMHRREAVLASNEFIREIANEPSLGLYFVQVKTAPRALFPPARASHTSLPPSLPSLALNSRIGSGN